MTTVAGPAMDDPIPRVVTLSWREARLAVLGAVDQRLYDLSRGLNDYIDSDVAGWGAAIVGVLGEWAVAKAFGYYWRGAAQSPGQRGDIGLFEVRSTPRRDGCLIVREKDADNAAFLLVCGQLPTFYLAGWLPGADAKQSRYWRTDDNGNIHKGGYFRVPQSALLPLDQLTDPEVRQ